MEKLYICSRAKDCWIESCEHKVPHKHQIIYDALTGEATENDCEYVPACSATGWPVECIPVVGDWDE